MPYPTAYDVTYSYTGFQQAQGDNSFPGTQIDADFAGLQANIESLTSFMSSVIRSDGALQNSIVTFDSLAAELQTAGLAPASAWATATQYAANANVIVNFGLYRAAVAHLSNVFATDLAAGRWTLVTNFPSVAYLAGTGLQLNTLTFSIDATVATLLGAQVLTNKVINASNNTVSNLTTAMFAANVIDTSVSLAANSDTRLPTQKAVKAYVDQIVASTDAMVFKGVIDCSANPNYPAADRGWTYRVSVAGKIGGASGVVVENGDLLTCMTDGTASGTQAAVGAQWAVGQTNIDGAVIGPASVTDDLPAIFDGVTGKLIKQKTYAAFKTLLALVKGDVGLGNVDNTSDATKNAAAVALTNKTLDLSNINSGDVRTTAQFDKTSNTTLGDVPGLSATVVAGQTYGFEATLYTTSNSASGVKAAIGGTATATALVCQTIGLDNTSGVASYGRTSSMATVSTGTTNTTNQTIRLTGVITVNAGGTLTAMFAQNVSGGVASSVLVGSTMRVWKIT